MPSSYWTAHTWASSPPSLRTKPPSAREGQITANHRNQSHCTQINLFRPAAADGLDPPCPPQLRGNVRSTTPYDIFQRRILAAGHRPTGPRGGGIDRPEGPS